MKLSKYEKETIILTNEEDQYYSVYTFNQGLQKRLKNFAEATQQKKEVNGILTCSRIRCFI